MPILKTEFLILPEKILLAPVLPINIFSSVQFSPSVMSDSAIPLTVAHQASLSTTNSQGLLKLMSIDSVMLSNHLFLFVPFSFCLQSFPESGSLPMSQFLASSGQSIGASASASILPMGIQD